MNDIYQEQAEITELVGMDSWEMVIDFFEKKTVKEIESDCNHMWPEEEGNAEFAQRVYDAVN